MKRYVRKQDICLECNEMKTIQGCGLCSACYQRGRSKDSEWRKHKNESNRKSYAKHSETLLLQKKEYYNQNRDIILAKSNQYYINNQDEVLIKAENRYKEHPKFSFLGKKLPLLYHKQSPPGYVWHHLVYDHADPEANMVLMENGAHTSIHNTFRTNGVKIPHINMEIDINE